MSKKVYRIFIINPGSTSTKLSLFENRKNIFTTDVFHDSSVLLTFPTINDQLEYRMKVIHEFLEEDHIDLTGIDAVVGRGGGCYAVPGGIYEVDEKTKKEMDELEDVGVLYDCKEVEVETENGSEKVLFYEYIEDTSFMKTRKPEGKWSVIRQDID